MHFDRADLKQSKHAIHRGEDQAMQDSLAAANAAAGDTVQGSLGTQAATPSGQTTDPVTANNRVQAELLTPHAQPATSEQQGVSACRSC